MDFRKSYNHSVLYPRNKMAFETPFVPGGLHFYFGPSGVKSDEKRNALMSAMLKTEVQTMQKLRQVL